jgi:hypothetical protein
MSLLLPLLLTLFILKIIVALIKLNEKDENTK